MNFSDKDLNAAIDANILSADQVKSFRGFVNARQVSQYVTRPDDEPFELFKGFNEIFIVVGLLILFAGWWGTFALRSFEMSAFADLSYHAVEILMICLLAEYFTKRRAMIAPSNLLVILFSLAAFSTGLIIEFLGDSLNETADYSKRVLSIIEWKVHTAFIPCVITTIALYIYWLRYRVPMALAGILFFALLGLIAGLHELFDIKDIDFSDLFTLDIGSPIGWATLSAGLIGLVFAMRFDLSDPHRITRRTRNAFWLHIASAPLVVNPIANTLYSEFGTLDVILLIIFLLFITLLTIIIDRRSFLISGIGYMIAVLYYFFEVNSAVLIFALGISLVLLGSAWTQLRARLMDWLPDFPYKSKLAPWREGAV